MESERTASLYGLTRTLISNMVLGVVHPWKKDLEIQGVGFRASKNGQTLNLQIGFSHPVDFKMPVNVQFTVDAKQTLVSLSSPDKELLGTIAARIRSLRKPEPYKGKGIRYVGEHIVRKAGKAAGAAGAGAGVGGAGAGPGGAKK
jgi:large subunit ribosomal protein L6